MRKLMLSLGADKGLHGVGLFMSEPSDIVTERIRSESLADFKGKKIRIFASQFQSVAFERLGVTPVGCRSATCCRPFSGRHRRCRHWDGTDRPHALCRRGEIRDDDQSTFDIHYRRNQQKVGTNPCPRICKRSSTRTARRNPLRSSRLRRVSAPKPRKAMRRAVAKRSS